MKNGKRGQLSFDWVFIFLDVIAKEGWWSANKRRKKWGYIRSNVATLETMSFLQAKIEDFTLQHLRAVFLNLLRAKSRQEADFSVTVPVTVFVTKISKDKAYKNVLFSSKYKENIGLLKLILTLFDDWLITIISNLFMSNLVNFKDSKTFQVPVRKHSSPGTGTRPGGWESLS
jgi:hypothetical protein